MISKELLSEVLGDNKIIGCSFTSEIGFDAIEYAWIGCRAIDDCMEFIDYINIYELAHKCKEWASNKGIGLASWVEQYPDGACQLTWKAEYITIDFSADSEPEAIFKACQWILDNGGNQ
jgi:hypothetical protein